MRAVARWVVGMSVVLASAQAFGEAAPAPPPPQQAAPQQQPAPTPVKAAPKKAAPAAKQAPKQVPPAGDGAQAASPPGPRCEIVPTKGTPIFESRYLAGKKAVITKLYASGTYTRVVAKQSPLRTACIEKDRLAAIRTALAESRWQTTKSPATCQAVSAEATEIYAAGKLRFTSRTCNPLVLDEKSSYALDLVGMYVGPFGLDIAAELQLQ
ncbi:MAG TPA: hypothetical protein VMZ53_07390 [Kofleriaceae bacterium]|nr:hypothetical protein [Kofleriaceae bacterium]